MSNRRIPVIALGAALVSVSPAVLAQACPARPIRIVLNTPVVQEGMAAIGNEPRATSRPGISAFVTDWKVALTSFILKRQQGEPT